VAKNIVVVSIVPCTAKKYEATRPELKYNGRNLVDHVLTTRELAFLIKKNKLNFVKLAKGQSSPLFNSGSGAAAIYGASGGVMESALRTAADLAASDQPQRAPGQPINSSPQKFLEYQAVRGLAGFKEATVTVGGRRLKVGVVNGIANFKRLLPKLGKYHYIEVMACPGGCLGGGGQPQPTTEAIRAKRLVGLYSIDKQRSVRRAHDNQEMMEYYNWVKKNKLSSKLLYTKFS
jgi:iron only hydrogenase large subunit-like protein